MCQFKEFPNFIQLDLKHKNVLEVWFNKYQQIVSELNFTELFMWRNSYKIYLSTINNNLCIFVNYYNDKYFYPIIGNNEIILSLKKLYNFAQQNNFQLKFKSVTKDFLSKISATNIELEEDYCFYDYVYKVSDLTNLPGSKFHPKKNLIRQFSSKYKYSFLPITKENIKNCIDFVIKWSEKNKPSKYLYKDFEDETVATIELLKNYFELNVIGSIIIVDNEIVALTIGSKLNDTTAVIHVEKAFKEFKGIYQTINQLFCKNMLSNYIYVNREQDLCDEGLKKAKLSYYPYEIIEKKVVTIKQL